jgi:hypothetical protein
MLRAADDVQFRPHKSEHIKSDELLPPPNRFKKNAAVNASVDPEHLRVIRAYKQAHRREAADFELYSNRSASPKLNPDDWRTVFHMSTSFRELMDSPK